MIAKVSAYDAANRVRLSFERPIDELIEAGWKVLETDFDHNAFLNWKVKASNCLKTLLGPDHVYTQSFIHSVRKPDAKDVLAGGGLLSAAREEIANSGTES